MWRFNRPVCRNHQIHSFACVTAKRNCTTRPGPSEAHIVSLVASWGHALESPRERQCKWATRAHIAAPRTPRSQGQTPKCADRTRHSSEFNECLSWRLWQPSKNPSCCQHCKNGVVDKLQTKPIRAFARVPCVACHATLTQINQWYQTNFRVSVKLIHTFSPGGRACRGAMSVGS